MQSIPSKQEVVRLLIAWTGQVSQRVNALGEAWHARANRRVLLSLQTLQVGDPPTGLHCRASMKTGYQETITKKLVLAKHLYTLAHENLRPENPITAYAGVNLLQDAVEVHLLALAEAVSANIDPNTKFERYFELIEEKLPSGVSLPSKVRLFALNKVRVNSKHYAIQPDLTEAISYLTTVRDFFEETTSALLDRAWASVTLIDLLSAGESQRCLLAAQAAYNEGRHSDCLIDAGRPYSSSLSVRLIFMEQYRTRQATTVCGPSCAARPPSRERGAILTPK
jgi:hypothetical protein